MDQSAHTTALFLFSLIVSAAAQKNPVDYGFEKMAGEEDRWIKWFDPNNLEEGGLEMTIAADGSAKFYSPQHKFPVIPDDYDGDLDVTDKGWEIPVKGWLTNAEGPLARPKPKKHPAKYGFEKMAGEGDRWIKWFDPNNLDEEGLEMTIAPDGSAKFFSPIHNMPDLPDDFGGNVKIQGWELPTKGWLTNAEGPPARQKKKKHPVDYGFEKMPGEEDRWIKWFDPKNPDEGGFEMTIAPDGTAKFSSPRHKIPEIDYNKKGKHTLKVDDDWEIPVKGWLTNAEGPLARQNTKNPVDYGFEKLPGEGDRWIKWFDPRNPDEGGLEMTIAPDGTAKFFSPRHEIPEIDYNKKGKHTLQVNDWEISVKGWLSNTEGPLARQNTKSPVDYGFEKMPGEGDRWIKWFDPRNTDKGGLEMTIAPDGTAKFFSPRHEIPEIDYNKKGKHTLQVDDWDIPVKGWLSNTEGPLARQTPKSPVDYGFEKMAGEGDRWIKWFDPSNTDKGGLEMTIAPDGTAKFFSPRHKIPEIDYNNKVKRTLKVDDWDIPVKGWLTNAEGPLARQNNSAGSKNINNNREEPSKEGDNSAGSKNINNNREEPSKKGDSLKDPGEKKLKPVATFHITSDFKPGQAHSEKDIEDILKSVVKQLSPKSLGTGAKKGAKVAVRIIYTDNSFKDPSGQAVAKWTREMEVNPQELGSYDQGDVLFPSPDPITKWPDGVVPYEINPAFSKQEKAFILRAMDEYHRRTCIRWVPRTTEPDYIYFTNEQTGCWSFIGRRLKRQEVNLGRGCLVILNTPEHEMMHALGFNHEQTRRERDKYVTIHFENVKPGRENNFALDENHAADMVEVPYDFDSIMHYTVKSFSKNGQLTIEPKVEGVAVGKREDSMSDIDVEKINRFYECPKV